MPANFPRASSLLDTYRYQGRFGFVWIGAKDTQSALKEAERSIEGVAVPERLERWSAEKRGFVRV